MSVKPGASGRRAPCTFDVRRVGPVSYVRLVGVIDETFNPAELQPHMLGHVLIDLGRIERISSFGVRRWMELTRALPVGAFSMSLLHAPPVLVDQLNMVEGFAGICKVLSVLAPYACDTCGEERVRVVDVRASLREITEGVAPSHVCSVCKNPMRFADVPGEYFDYLRHHPLGTVEPVIERYLASLRPGVAAAPTGHAKVVQGDLTYVRMGSAITGDLSVRKLAGGSEGTVVYDFAGVGTIDQVGGAKLVEVLTEASKTSRVFLWRVPPAVLEVLAKRLVRPKVGLATIYVPGECLSCGSSVPLQIDAEKYHREMMTAGEPANRVCAVCGGSARPPKLDAVVPLLAACPARDVPSTEIEAIEARALSQLLHGPAGPSGTPAADRLVGADSGAQLQVIKRIGEGGMAEVFLARQAGLKGFEKYVVVKKILPQFARSKDFVEMLFAEARANARLTHPNVVQIFDVGVADGLAYISMEYVRGPDLKRVIVMLRKAGMLMPVPHALRLVAETAAGLHYAHTFIDPMGAPHPVIHRDVSPHNILVSLDGAVKLSDFGIAKVNEGGEHTRPGTFKGKVSYTSPEAIRGLPLDARHDVFSLGIVLFEALTGYVPFRGDNDPATLTSIIEQPTPDPRQVNPALPDGVVEVVFRALAKQADQRYQSAGELREAIEQVMHQYGFRSSPTDVASFFRDLLGEQLREFSPAGGTLPPTSTAGSRSGPVVVPSASGGSRASGTPGPRPSATPGSRAGTPRPAGTPAPRASPSLTAPSGPRPPDQPRPSAPTRIAQGGPPGTSGTPAPVTAGTPHPGSGNTPVPARTGTTPLPSGRTGTTPLPPGRTGTTPLPPGRTGTTPAPRTGTTPVPSAPRAGAPAVVVGELLDGRRPSLTMPEVEDASGRGLLFGGIGAVVLVAIAAVLWFALRSDEKYVDVQNLGADEHLYVNGLRVDPRAIKPAPDRVVVAVAAGGRLKRLGTSVLQEELNITSLFEASAGAGQQASLNVTEPAGCTVVVGGTTLPTPTPVTAPVPAGSELELVVKCGEGTPWTRSILAGPGQSIEIAAK